MLSLGLSIYPTTLGAGMVDHIILVGHNGKVFDILGIQKRKDKPSNWFLENRRSENPLMKKVMSGRNFLTYFGTYTAAQLKIKITVLMTMARATRLPRYETTSWRISTSSCLFRDKSFPWVRL
jgi:hypothetical protein